jgi:hypothetical protein
LRVLIADKFIDETFIMNLLRVDGIRVYNQHEFLIRKMQTCWVSRNLTALQQFTPTCAAKKMQY